MEIQALNISGFRSMRDFSIDFHRKFTTMVGENSAGKSTVPDAVVKLLRRYSNGENITQSDFPYLKVSDMTIKGTFELSLDEIEGIFGDVLFRPRLERRGTIQEFFANQGNVLQLSLSLPASPLDFTLTWGSVRFKGQEMWIGDPIEGDAPQQWTRRSADLDQSCSVSGQRLVHADAINQIFELPYEAPNVVAQHILGKLKVITDFPIRDRLQNRTGELESLTGSATASVLLTLRNHLRREQRQRYGQVIDVFKRFFDRYQDVIAVEQTPGGVPDIQFYEKGQSDPFKVDPLI